MFGYPPATGSRLVMMHPGLRFYHYHIKLQAYGQLSDRLHPNQTVFLPADDHPGSTAIYAGVVVQFPFNSLLLMVKPNSSIITGRPCLARSVSKFVITVLCCCPAVPPVRTFSPNFLRSGLEKLANVRRNNGSTCIKVSSLKPDTQLSITCHRF